MIENLGAALHAVAFDGLAIAMVQVLAQAIEVATRAGLDLGRAGGRSTGPSLIDHHSIGSFLVAIFSLGQGRDGPPQRLLESARAGLLQGQRLAQRRSGARCDRRSATKPAAASRSLAICGSLSSHASRVVSFAIRSSARANEAAQGSREIFAKIEQLAQVLRGGVAKLARLACEQLGSFAMAGAIEQVGREQERAFARGCRFGGDAS